MSDAPSFDYAALPVPAALDLRAAATRIRTRMEAVATNIIAIGEDLITVKNSLPHGRWLPWIEAEFGMSKSSAENYMAVAERFGSKIPMVGNLAPTVLYALAAPSTPDEVVAEVVTRAGNGEKVNTDLVKKLKAKAQAEKERADALRSEKERIEISVARMAEEAEGLRGQISFLKDEARRAQGNVVTEKVIEYVEVLPAAFKTVDDAVAARRDELAALEERASQNRIAAVISAFLALSDAEQGQVLKAIGAAQ